MPASKERPRQAASTILESPEAVLTTLSKDGRRNWMYPVPSPGRYHSARRLVAWVLILLYVALPLIPVGGHPAVLLDFVHREFALFGLVFYPTDTLLLMIFLIGVLLSVVLFTALLGRVWCGWGCPQTVYLEFVFRPIERWLEGAEHVRRRRDDGPWTFDKAWRKTAKFAIYLAISLVLAHTFVAYFVGWDSLLVWMTGPPTEHWGFFVVMAVTTGLVFFDFAVFREQMCTITCPYARMQSVLLDPDSLIVSYDPTRGEPRGKRSKASASGDGAPALGDCVDCGACVRTCPTGIDIREGLQMECIACTQCIDACDAIMDRVGTPRGLIRYSSEREIEGRKTRLVRPHTVLYTVLLLAAVSAFAFTLSSRGAYDVNVGRAVGEPYTTLPDGRVANRLRFRVRNQTGAPSTFSVRIVSVIPGAGEEGEHAPVQAGLNPVGPMPVSLAPGEMARLETWVMIPVEGFDDGVATGRFAIEFSDGTVVEESFPLLGPNG